MDRIPPDTARRDEAGERRFGSVEELRDFCRPIGQGWFRCQALAIGGITLPSDDGCVRACLDAEAAAAGETDPYKQTACLAWPISALLSRGRSDEARAMTARAVSAARRVTPTSSRADALAHLLQAAWPLGDETRRGIVTDLFGLLAADPHWRVRRACREAAHFFRDEDRPAWLHELVRGCEDGANVTRIKDAWAGAGGSSPRVYVESPGRSEPDA